MDVQVSDTAPAGASYRLWPSYPVIPPPANEDDLEQTFGTEFGGQNRWVDVEVTPAPESPPPPGSAAGSAAFLTFFP